MHTVHLHPQPQRNESRKQAGASLPVFAEGDATLGEARREARDADRGNIVARLLGRNVELIAQAVVDRQLRRGLEVILEEAGVFGRAQKARMVAGTARLPARQTLQEIDESVARAAEPFQPRPLLVAEIEIAASVGRVVDHVELDPADLAPDLEEVAPFVEGELVNKLEDVVTARALA